MQTVFWTDAVLFAASPKPRASEDVAGVKGCTRASLKFSSSPLDKICSTSAGHQRCWGIRGWDLSCSGQRLLSKTCHRVGTSKAVWEVWSEAGTEWVLMVPKERDVLRQLFCYGLCHSLEWETEIRVSLARGTQFRLWLNQEDMWVEEGSHQDRLFLCSLLGDIGKPMEV